MIKNTDANTPSREWTLRMADAEDRSGSVLAGGLASAVGMIRDCVPATPRVFAQLIEYARRSRGLTIEQLGREADIDLAELVATERDGDFVPPRRTVEKLASALGLAPRKLLALSGHEADADSSLAEAALRFAARTERSGELSRNERDALAEFVKVLGDATDKR